MEIIETLENLEQQKAELSKIIQNIQLSITNIKALPEGQERSKAHSQAVFNLTRANTSMIDLKAKIKEVKAETELKQKEAAQKEREERRIAHQLALEEGAKRRQAKLAQQKAHDEEWAKLSAAEQASRRSFGKMLKEKFSSFNDQYINKQTA